LVSEEGLCYMELVWFNLIYFLSFYFFVCLFTC